MNGLPVEPRITEYLYRKATASGVPLSGTFELTPVCNMNCKMCYVRLSGQEQQAIGPLADANAWLQLAQQAKSAGMLYLLVTGGEPMMHPQFRQIMEGLHKMGFLLSLNTNGTMIDADTANWMKSCPPMRVNISLYGTSDETYGRLCGNPKGFSQVENAIGLLREAGINVKLNCSLTPENASQLPEMVEFAKARNLILQVATYMFPPLRKDGQMAGKNHRFTPEEAAYYMAYADYLTLGAERFLGTEGLYPDVQEPDQPCADLGDGIRCRAGRCSFWITWLGEMTPCGMFPGGDYPNVFAQPFTDAWEIVKNRTAAISLPAKCSVCSIKDTCHACAAMVVTETGCFDKIPQYRCDMMRASRQQWEQIKEEML